MKKYLSRLIAACLALALLAAPASALTVDEALELLEENYYYGVPDEAYQAQTLDELIRLLGDPYTEYMTEEEYALFLDLVEDTVKTVGIGVEITYTQEGFLVQRVLSGGSALEGGLQAGDLIVAVDGTSCAPAREEHRQLMLGEEGTRVTVTVLRNGQAKDYTLTRRAVQIPNTEVTLLEGGVGYVDCDSFGQDTDELFTAGLKKYDSQVSCWIVDLRDNVGGYVDSAVEMMAAVNGPGCYRYFEDSAGEVYGYVCPSSAVTKKPLLVLVNRQSASASELFSAGVRDTDRGLIIGSRTYGKGVAQTILDEDSDPEYFNGDGLKVSFARFYAPGANTTDKIGVIPTLLVDDRYTEAVAAALCGGNENDSDLCLVTETGTFYVNPDTPDDVLCALLEALSPQVTLFQRVNGVFGQCIPAEAAARLGLRYHDRWFSDLEDSRYRFAINAMGAYQLLNGTEPGVFSPKGQLTRAQLCVMLARVLNVSAAGASRFSDVPAGAWYAAGVNAMAELGLVNGVGGGKFAPNSTLTQEEFLTIMGRTARYLNFVLDDYGEVVENAGDKLPPDMEQALEPYADWARSSAAVLAWGLEDRMQVSGDLLYASLERITPTAPILREEAAAGMYAVLQGLDILP